MNIIDTVECDIVLFLRTLFEERNELDRMIVNLRKEVNERDIILKKYTADSCPYPTYIDLESDTLASYYDNPVYKKYYEYLKDFI
jgi:hypothetical protein